MNEGDLVFWVGKQTETSSLKNRVVYQVVKRVAESSTYGEHVRLTLRCAFDFSQPMGTSIGTVMWSEHELRKVSLVDLGVLRLSFDNFIREYARFQGMEDSDDSAAGTG